MKIRIKYVKISEIGQYIVPTNVFLNPNLLSLLNKYFNYNIHYLVAIDADSSNTLSAFAIYEKSILRIANIFKPQIVYYQPIEYYLPEKKCPNQNELIKLDIQKSYAKYISKNYLKVHFNLAPENDDVRGFLWSGLKASPFYTYLFDLKHYSIDSYFKKQRTSLRKGISQNYSITSKPMLKDFFSLSEKTKERSKWNFNFNEDKLSGLLYELIEKKLAVQYNFCSSENKLLASMICLMDKNNKIVYAWLSTSSPDEMSNGITPFMFHSIIDYIKKDYDYFDLCGANTETIARFKASFGTILKPFYRISI